MKAIRLIVAALAVSSVISAGEVDGGAVLGSAIGAAAGTAVGSAIGGKEGAILGGAAGGAVGAAVGSEKESANGRDSKVVVKERVIIRDGDDGYNEHRDNGKHKGQYKNKHRNKHGRDD